MSGKIKIELENVQQTLLLPLWGRAYETKKENPRLVDKKAVEIIDNIDYDFSTISKNINFISQLAWVARSWHIDNAIREFISSHDDATIVNIGCGLDTTFERADPKNARFFDIDLPDVVQLRANFFQDNEKRKTISSSFLEKKWIDEISTDRNVLFIAAGVLYYFQENQIKDFFTFLADRLKNCELFFDSSSPLGVKVANKKVLKAGGMDKTAVLKWGLKNARSIEMWDDRFKVKKVIPMFHRFKKGYPLKVKYGLWMSDVLNIMSMVHLSINQQ